MHILPNIHGKIKGLHPLLLLKLRMLSYMANVKITVISGKRSKSHNKKVGGVNNSEHLTGEGADIVVNNSNEMFKLVKFALLLGFVRIGIKSHSLHLGISKLRPQNVLWTYYK